MQGQCGCLSARRGDSAIDGTARLITTREPRVIVTLLSSLTCAEVRGGLSPVGSDGRGGGAPGLRQGSLWRERGHSTGSGDSVRLRHPRRSTGIGVDLRVGTPHWRDRVATEPGAAQVRVALSACSSVRTRSVSASARAVRGELRLGRHGVPRCARRRSQTVPARSGLLRMRVPQSRTAGRVLAAPG